MIIKGLFRRYERWNPVHPTSGAFWGMGIGIGCGVGWGPGFGPEVIGYVGAGCGVGFSVGITLAGFGIGLPANYVFKVPYNAFLATRSGVSMFSRSSGLLSLRNASANGWNKIAPHIGLQKKAGGSFSTFNLKDSVDKVADFSDMKSVISSHTRSILDRLQKVGANFHPQKGLKD
ncbi:cadmium-induced protein AS8 isoform X2 [Diospyros lotus]|nr:cadmium-induced protein AS8 isoform X2 [Diospyros lotus]XP_052209809.1 cadmium-induced protein AS8 isoform X2 [Diospyros lotus]XP_052209810.1 cadmium-induced protein AS8 isoform X2 [Diospyros lotus]XP_052209811.1 cadmium-induced protein AS8 isoform X2 [Diospyros lotus]XP_052209812.1 cadmium-induced protein AS8 isoform X2 [Diospyros lotus]